MSDDPKLEDMPYQLLPHLREAAQQLAEDITRARVRLSDLPGFDPVGLFAYVMGDEEDERSLVLHANADEVWLQRDDGLYNDTPSRFLTDVFVSATDASTRDRLVRWMTLRIHEDDEKNPATAPYWGLAGSHERPTFVLMPRTQPRGTVFAAAWSRQVDVVVPALAGVAFRPGLSEWMAMAIVATHLGMST